MSDRAEAEALDRADPLAGWRDQFLIPDPDLAYLDGNSLGRTPLATVQRLRRLVEEEWAGDLIRGWERWMDLPLQVGDRLAPLIGADPGEVVVHDSTTVDLYQLVHAAVALRPDRPVLAVSPDDFPTDRYVVAGIADELGLELRDDPDALDGVGVVVRSLVDYRTGERHDLAATTAAARDAGAVVVWDLSHAVGAIEVDVHAAGVELAVGCTYKYLNGGPGAPAFSYVARDLHPRLRQPLWGWFAQREPLLMAPEYDPDDGIRRLLIGTAPILGLAAAEVGIGMVADAGMPAIAAKGRALTTYALRLADELGLPSPTPRDPDRRGAHVSIAHPDAGRLNDELVEHGVIADFRRPGLVRLGCSALTTRFIDVHDGLTRLARLA